MNLLSKKVSEISLAKDYGDGMPQQSSSSEKSLLQKIIRKALIENKNDIVIQKLDPNCPLFSNKSFEDLKLKPSLLKGIHAAGYKTPSHIQATAIPALLANPPRNLIAQSPHRTGKTATFVLAMLSRVDPTKHYPQILCLSPTYELALHTGKVAYTLAQYCPKILMKIVVRGGKVARNTKMKHQILIGTPRKVLEWAVKYRLFDLSKISVFILDEADVMIATPGIQDQFLRIYKCLNIKCQMIFFSTKYDNYEMEFVELMVLNPIVIILKRDQENFGHIKQYYVQCTDLQEKYTTVTNIYDALDVQQCIIFCHPRRNAIWLAEKLSKDGHAVALLTGGLTDEERTSVLDRFCASQEKVLITTNILPKGIPIEQVTIVVNFDFPIDEDGNADCDTYLDRIGRTGQYSKTGIAINLINLPEVVTICDSIEAHFGKRIKYVDAKDLVENIGI